jgi:hypothetical protein
MTDQDIETRLPVWTALSELFLDTELQDDDYARIAAVLGRSGLPHERLQAILNYEVAPVFAFNLVDLAGEWTPWSEEEVLEIMSAPRRESVLTWMGAWRTRRYLTSQWLKIASHLPR